MSVNDYATANEYDFSHLTGPYLDDDGNIVYQEKEELIELMEKQLQMNREWDQIRLMGFWG